MHQSHAKSLPLAVHGGGHSRLGYGLCDGGVAIDPSEMKRVEVDAGKPVARAEAGALVRDLDEATQHFGLVTTSGGCPTVGIAGLTLGRGEGRVIERSTGPRLTTCCPRKWLGWCILPKEAVWRPTSAPAR
jgi:FAD/FMN-containing dehydrogenase